MTPDPTFPAEVTATVTAATVAPLPKPHIVSGTPYADKTHFIFVTLTIQNGLEVPPIKKVLLRFSQSGSGNLDASVRECSQSMVPSIKIVGALKRDGSVSPVQRVCDVSSRVLPGLVGTYYFAIVCLGGTLTLTNCSCELKGFDRDSEDARVLGLERPGFLDVPSPFGDAEVDLLGGTLSLAFPLFSEGTDSNQIPLTISYRSPRRRIGTAWAPGVLGERWRLSIEHDLCQDGKEYIYRDGSGFLHRFVLASKRKPSGPRYYVDQSGTRALLSVDGTSRSILFPSGAIIEFDASGKGVRVSRQTAENHEEYYEIEYSSGVPIRVFTSSMTWITLSYATNQVQITSAKYGSWSIGLASYGVSSVSEPNGFTASLSYQNYGDSIVSAFKAVSSLSYRGSALTLSRDSKVRVSTVSLSRSSQTVSETGFAYGPLQTVVSNRAFGNSATDRRFGYDFREDGECVCEYEVEQDGFSRAVGYSLSDSAYGEMMAFGTKPEWTGVDTDFNSTTPCSEGFSAGTSFCAGSFLCLSVKAENSQLFTRMNYGTVKVDFLDSSDSVLSSSTLTFLEDSWRPFFLPIPDEILSDLAGIGFSTPTANRHIYIRGISIRYNPSGFSVRGYNCNALWPVSPVSIATCSPCDVKIENGDNSQTVSAPSDYASFLDSVVMSRRLPSDVNVLFVDDGRDAYIAESISVQTSISPLTWISIDNAQPASEVRAFRRRFNETTGVFEAFEKSTVVRRTFEAFNGSGGYREIQTTELYTPNEILGTTIQKTVLYNDYLQQVASFSGDFGEAIEYDSIGRPLATRRAGKAILPNGSLSSAQTALLGTNTYDALGMCTATLLSAGPLLYGDHFYYSSVGKLLALAPAGADSDGPYDYAYQSQLLTGINYWDEFDNHLLNREVPDATDGDLCYLSLAVGNNDELSMTSECVAGASSLTHYFDSDQEWGIAERVSFNASGNRIEVIEDADGLELESNTYDAKGRLIASSVGGLQTFSAAYESTDWKQHLPAQIDLFGSNSPILMQYDDDGRLVKRICGSVSCDVTYATAMGNNGYESKTTSTYSGTTIIASETEASGVSTQFPFGYSSVSTVGVGSYPVTVMDFKSGPQLCRARILERDTLTSSETIQFGQDSADEDSDETLIPAKMTYSVVIGGSYTLAEETYGHDAAGRINSVSDPTRGYSATFSRNSVTLALEQETMTLGGITSTRTYSYDPAGNVSSVTRGLNDFTTYSYSGELLCSETTGGLTSYFEYDSAGRMTERRGAQVVWSGYRLLSIAGLGSLTYDKSLLTGEQNADQSLTYGMIYVLGVLRRETLQTAANMYSIDYVYAPGGEVAGFMMGNSFYTLRRNVFGDVTTIYQGINPVAAYVYGAFGDTRVLKRLPNGSWVDDSDPASPGNMNPFRYRGMRYYRTLGVYQMGARVYDPSIMRFMTPDRPKYLDALRRYGLNPYCYCYNDPVTYTDATGHFPVLAVILGVTAAVGLGLTIGGVASSNNVLTAAGLGMVGGAALVSGGIAVIGAIGSGAILSGIIGGGTVLAGAGSLTFMSAEIQEATGAGNWIMDASGMSDTLYNQLLLGTASIAAAGTIASSITNAFQIRSIQDFGRYGDYYGMRFTNGRGKTRVLAFHTHSHGTNGILGWHWQLTKYNPVEGKTAGAIARWLCWKLTRL